MNVLRFDLNALARPKSRDDVLALAAEALAEMRMINAHLERALAPAVKGEPA